MKYNDKFEEYVTSWFHQYVQAHEEDEEVLLALFEDICERKDDGSLPNVLGDEQTIYDWLMDCPAYQIYSQLFGYGENLLRLDDMPTAEEFIYDMLKDVCCELDINKYEFINEFISDMAYHIANYETPTGFFEDLQHGGCASGMIGMMIYNNDCLELYRKYANDMEEFREDIEEEIGEIKRDRNLYHYVWICWLCYEELAYRVSLYLFEHKF